MIKITAKVFAERTGLSLGYVYQLAYRRKVKMRDTNAVLDLLHEYENKKHEKKV